MLRYVLMILLVPVCLYAQVTGYLETFDDNDLDGWTMQNPHTFFLTIVDSALQITYLRDSDSELWDQFNFTPPLVDVSDKPYISLRVKSDVSTELTLKPIYENGNDGWLQTLLVADNLWHTVTFELTQHGGAALNRIYVYLDGGTTEPNQGTVYFDDLAIGDSVSVIHTPDYNALDLALQQANALYENSQEGTAEGQFPFGSRAILKSAIDSAQNIYEKTDVPPDDLNTAVWNLYNACVTFEASVYASDMGLLDSNATKETRYLYGNLLQTADKGLIFGMHDVTGYGVGWSGDDDKSDVKDVCGDYPALYSEDANKITRNSQVDRLRYRVTSAYERGGIITFSWHQYDPDDRSFYADEIDNERIVEKIIPGGERHEDYKEKLKRLASFLMGLRGNNGESIPVIFRPYHEHLGDWFWWGPAHCTTEEYNEIWQFTVHYLRDSLNVHNLIYAISPSLSAIRQGDDYFDVYPGDEYVDIFGTDNYFSHPVYQNARDQFINGLRKVVEHARARNKLPALTEVGQEGLESYDWFTDVLLPPLKYDSVASSIAYAAVWRNANTTHHFAPYPGHPSVPDFLEFYNDPYTLFQQDLNDMYSFPEEDKAPPVVTILHENPFVATALNFTIQAETNERADLRYAMQEMSWEEMPNEFQEGQGGRQHRTLLTGEQGQQFTLFFRACDLYGNVSDAQSLTIYVDTLQAPVLWTDLQYPDSAWSRADTPLGFGTDFEGSMTQRQTTVYFRKYFEFTDSIEPLGLLLKCSSGIIAYINGREVYRTNVPTGDLSADDLAYDPKSLNKIVTLQKSLLTEVLNPGENILAVEVHTAGEENPSLYFDARLFSANKFYIDLGTEWLYEDSGQRPRDCTLGEILAVDEQSDHDTKNRTIEKFALLQNYPNPFNPVTVIEYQLPVPANVKLELLDITGRCVQVLVNETRQAGIHRFIFQGEHLASGLYLYRLHADDCVQTRRFILLK